MAVARRKPIPQPSFLPIETMAATLAISGLDVADDAICIQILVAAGFSSRHVLAGLSEAQDRARELLVEAA